MSGLLSTAGNLVLPGDGIERQLRRVERDDRRSAVARERARPRQQWRHHLRDGRPVRAGRRRRHAVGVRDERLAKKVAVTFFANGDSRMVSARVACCRPSPFFAKKGDSHLFLIAAALSLAAAQPPQFTSGVERILVDVQIVDSQGRPIASLTAADFEVRLDQGLRNRSAEPVRTAALDTPASGATAATGDATPTPAAGRGRDFVLAIDESSFQTRYAPAAVRAARGFVERLAPADRCRTLHVSRVPSASSW